MLTDRRDELTRQRVQTVNRLHRLLSELTPGKAKKDLTALQAKAIRLFTIEGVAGVGSRLLRVGIWRCSW